MAARRCGMRSHASSAGRGGAAGRWLPVGLLLAALAGLRRRPGADPSAFSAACLQRPRSWCSPPRLAGVGPARRSASAAAGAPAPGVDEEEGTGQRAASLNLAKNLVGSGILSVPSGVAAFSASSGALGPSLLLLVLAAFVSAYGFFLIGRVCEETKATTFKSAWERTVGRGSWVPQLCCILECLGGSIVYAMVLGDMFSSLAQGLWGASSVLAARSTIIAVIGVAVLYPLCCLRTFGQLAKFSALGTLATSFVVLFVVKRFVDTSYGPLGAFHQRSAMPVLDAVGGGVNARILVLASILSTAFLVHFNAPQMYTELKPSRPLDDAPEKAKKQANFFNVAIWGFGIASLQYGLVMVFGFLTFGRFTDGNLLLNYSTADSWAIAARVAVGISTLFGYPMQFAGLRSGLLEAFGREQPLPRVQHRLFTASLLAVIVGIACLLSDLGKFQAVEGALLASFLMYIAPPMMAWTLWKRPGARIRYASVIALGVVVSIVGCLVTVLQ